MNSEHSERARFLLGAMRENTLPKEPLERALSEGTKKKWKITGLLHDRKMYLSKAHCGSTRAHRHLLEHCESTSPKSEFSRKSDDSKILHSVRARYESTKVKSLLLNCLYLNKNMW